MQDSFTSTAFRVVHTTPERIRILIPQLRHDLVYADRCHQLAKSLDGITNVRINCAASSIIINYKSDVLTSQDVENHLAYCINQLIQLYPEREESLELKDTSPDVESTEESTLNLKGKIVEEAAENIGCSFGEKVGEVVGETVGSLLLGVEGAVIGTEVGALVGECLGEEIGDALTKARQCDSDSKKDLDAAKLTEILIEVEHEVPHVVEEAAGLGVGGVIGEVVGEVVGGMLLGPVGMAIGAEVGGLVGGEIGKELIEIAEHSDEISNDSKS